MATIAEALSLGTQHHQAGRLAEAEQIYRQILAVQPENPHALHLMGMLALQCRQFSQAIDCITRAIRSDGSQSVFYANLGEAYRHSGQLDAAIAHYRRAIAGGVAQASKMLGTALIGARKWGEAETSLRAYLQSAPHDAEACCQLGHVLHEQNKLADSEACFRHVLTTDPHSAPAHYQLGSVLQTQGRAAEAAESYRRAIALDPGHADAHNNLGTLLKDQKQLDSARWHFEQALQAQAGHAPALTNLALVYEAQADYPQAEKYFRAAAAADPKSAVARHGLGAALDKQGHAAEALACYQQALQIDPRFVTAHFSISYWYQVQCQLDAAVAWCQKALEIDPNNANLHSNLGAARNEMGQRDEAIASFNRAIELDPALAVAYSNRGVAQQALGLLDEAIASHRRAVELEPDNAGSHSNLLYALNYHPAYTPHQIFSEHVAWGHRHADPLTVDSPPHDNSREPERRLRIGYVSPHFHDHAVNFFSEPILASHDHGPFEVFCYSDARHEDDATARLRGYADQWRDTLRLTDERLAELVRSDRIDILVDLTGHISGGKRMMMFARRPAPVQVTYIGYQNTTGMHAMDYRLTDAYSDPPGETDALHTERLARLPQTFFCYQPSSDAPPVAPLPATANGFVTFGSVNNFTKVTPGVLHAWAQVLKGVPGSRLVILADMVRSLRERISATMIGHGIAAEQLELINRVPRSGYLKLVNRIDIALDPFPFNGHTTTCDCLWQGVPVVTLSGTTYVSRFGGSGLSTLGLQDWIARTPEEYVRLAVEKAGDLAGLARLRRELRSRMAASPLLDFEQFTRNLEGEYRRMWRAWCETRA